MGERIEFSRPASLPGIEVLLGEHTSRRWRWFHETYSLCTVLGGLGRTEWLYRGNVYAADPGEVLLYEAGEVHSNRNVLEDASFRVLFIPPSVVHAAAAELGLQGEQPHWDVMHTPAPALYMSLAGLHQALERAAPGLEVEARFAACVRHLLEGCSEKRAKQARSFRREGLRRTRDFIHANYQRSISLAELSRIAGLSRFHLSRAFAAQYGLPPHAYQIALRVAKARAILSTGERPANLAAHLGFSDQSHFNRHFQRVVGKAPGTYARMILQ